MPHVVSDGIDIRYVEEGAGDPVLLIHGFASNLEVNWVGTGWVSLLTGHGRRVVAFDHRGHGESTKLYDPDDYRVELLVEDAVRVLDAAGVERADVIGYSMGSRVASYLVDRHPERVGSLVLGGMGATLLRGGRGGEKIAQALEAPSREVVTDPYTRMFRVFAENTRSDLRALAACMRGLRAVITPEMLGRIAVPVLVAVGTEDDVAGSPYDLAAYIPDAEVLAIAGRDHNRAVGSRPFKDGVLEFWTRHSGEDRP
ncbi:MAG TPA: alpha/beta hydrolase [Hyphomicrobiales bacterium]|nr:alpha/beta hydrolase [Hyphomicrobiales bacterium]